MKKLFLFGVLAAALGFSACSTEDELMGGNTQQGMILKATVAQPTTRATIDNSQTNWDFAFSVNDQMVVENWQGDVQKGTYTFEAITSENFTCADAQPTETATKWVAYYPSTTINLTNQGGTLEDAANRYALMGTTTSTGEDGLTIAMEPQAAILKIINNTDNAIDIRLEKDLWNDDVNDWTERYIKELKATADGFEVEYNGEEACSLLKASGKGTYYIVIPAKTSFNVYNGDKYLTYADYPEDGEGDEEGDSYKGIEPGKYYSLTIDYDGLLTGNYSVASNKKVQFTSNNLSIDCSRYEVPTIENLYLDSDQTWVVEDYDFLNPEVEYDEWGYLQHFYWNNYVDYSSQTASFLPWETSYTKSAEATTDEFWCSESHPLTYLETDGLYALSSAEWTYLFNTRTNANNLYKYPVTVNDVAGCLVIAPDDFEGTIADQYDYYEWDKAGLVCLPPNGTRSGYSWINKPEIAIWTSTPDPDKASRAMYLTIDETTNKPTILSGLRSYGYAIRLVRTVK